MHIELTEMLRCPESHREEPLVLSTGEMRGRTVWSGLVGCPVCRREYPIFQGIVDFRRAGAGVTEERTPRPTPPSPLPGAGADRLQALLELSGPGGYVVLVGAAARQAGGLAALIDGVHFVGVNAPPDLGEQPTLSLLCTRDTVPLRSAMARGIVIGADLARSPWLVEAHRVLLPGRRCVVESETPELPIGLERLAASEGLWVGAKR
ncbi:MAG: hypothetical protein ACREMN_12820 [Gemmatimonadales bacterium]